MVVKWRDEASGGSGMRWYSRRSGARRQCPPMPRRSFSPGLLTRTRVESSHRRTPSDSERKYLSVREPLRAEEHKGLPVNPTASAHAEGPLWTTAISTLEPQLLYRGYPVDELAERSQILETAFLLIAGEIPTDEQLADWQALLHESFALPASLLKWLKRVPSEAELTDVLLAALAREALRSRGEGGDSPRDVYPFWLGRLTALITTWRRLKQGLPLVKPRSELSYVANLWWLLTTQEPPGWLEFVLDAVFILCAEHGLAPSTVAVRMASAARSDFSSALQAGIAVARGSWAAGAAAEALEVLGAVRSPERAGSWVAATLERQGHIPGFRHRAYRVGDPRTESLTTVCRRVAERTGREDREQLASAVEHAVWDRAQLLPALSWPVSRLLDNLRLEQELFVPLYVLSRLAGWTAHFQEQLQQPEQAVVRSRYVGEPLRHLRRMNEPK
jgi:citrate synthase